MALTGQHTAMAEKIADNMIAAGIVQEQYRQDVIDTWVEVCKGIIEEIVASAVVDLGSASVPSGIALAADDGVVFVTGATTEGKAISGGGSIT